MKVLSLLAVAVLVSGCVGGGAVESKFEDADRHFGKRFTGGSEERKTVDIPVGTSGLTVKAAWKITGGATFVLEDPAGREKKSEEIGGTAESEDDEWFVVRNPTPGAWDLTISVGGTGAYSFGFYY